MGFIEWCNANMGFASLLLSGLTFLVSVLAIIVSLQTSRLPYKKKLLVVAGNFISPDDMGFHITATNIGNRNIKIKTIGFLIGKSTYINTNTIFESRKILTQGEETSQYYNIDWLQAAIIKANVKESALIWAFVEDTEGKKYKKRFARVGKLLNLEV